MELINETEVERKIDYWHYALDKIERQMMKEQGERVDIKLKLVHLNSLREHIRLQNPISQ